MTANTDISIFFPPETPTSLAEKVTMPTPDTINDYKQSRQTFQDLIDQGMSSLSRMLQVAEESGHPRAFEVVAIMLKTLSEVNEKSFDLQKKMKDIQTPTKGTGASGPISNIEKAVFVGTPKDLFEAQVYDKRKKLDKE